MREAQFDLHAELEQRHWWFLGRRRIIGRLLRRIAEPGVGHRIVDWGCGTGANLAALVEEYRGIGFDPSPRAIELARRRFPGLELAVLEQGSLERPELREAACLLLLDVLEHVDEDVALLAALVERLPRGAHLILTVPADPRLWSEHDVTFGHRRRYELGSLTRLWSELPVEVRLCSCFNARLYPLIFAVRAISRRRGRASGRGGTDFGAMPGPLNRFLANLFAGEASPLLRGLDRRGEPVYRRGTSLIAILRRI